MTVRPSKRGIEENHGSRNGLRTESWSRFTGTLRKSSQDIRETSQSKMNRPTANAGARSSSKIEAESCHLVG